MARRWSASAGLAALLVLHLNGVPESAPLLCMGWIPYEFAWRCAWIALALVYLAGFTRDATNGEDAPRP